MITKLCQYSDDHFQENTLYNLDWNILRMKKQLLTLSTILSGGCAMAQTTTNALPTMANADDGTTAPDRSLIINEKAPEPRFLSQLFVQIL